MIKWENSVYLLKIAVIFDIYKSHAAVIHYT